jgi:conjugative transfer region protein TrbK
MTPHLTPRQYARVAAVGFVVLIVAFAISLSRRDEHASIVVVPLEREQVDALATELLRCRTVMPDNTASLENCRQVWAANRRQFFSASKTPLSPTESTTATVTGKLQDRISPVEAVHQPSEAR